MAVPVIPSPQPGLQLNEREQKDLFGFVKEERWEPALKRDDRVEFEEQAHINTAFWEGKQWFNYSGQRREITPRKVEHWRHRVMVNRTYKWFQAMLAEMVAERVQWHGIPGSDEEADKAAARFAERLLQYLYHHLDFDVKQIEIWTYVLVRKCCFVKLSWNPNIGPMGPQGPLGDIEITARDPLSVYPDPNASAWSRARNVVEVSLQHEDWVRERYGQTVKPDSDVDVATAQYRVGRMFRQMLASVHFYKTEKRHQNEAGGGSKKMLRVFEYWELPSKDYSQGRYVVCANNRVLDYRPFPYGRPGEQQLPYVMVSNSVTPWNMYPYAPIDNVVVLNYEINELRSQRAQRRDKQMSLPLLVPETANLNKTALKGMPGEITQFSGIVPPSWMPQIPEDRTSTEDIAILDRDIEDVGGDAALIHGQNLPNVRTWGQQEGLINRALRKLIPGARIYEASLRAMGKQALHICRQFMDEGRMLYAVGQDGKYEYFRFSKAELQHNMDIRVQAGAVVAREKMEHRALAFQLMEMGYFALPPQMQERIARMIGFDQVELLLDPDKRAEDETIAQENELLRQGFPIPITNGQDHLQHLTGHMKLQKALDWWSYPVPVQMVIQWHTDQHIVAFQNVLDAMNQPPEPKGGGSSSTTKK